ncbi:hypothetical protein GCM10027440_52660 [Nocardiopsis coralliicola]
MRIGGAGCAGAGAVAPGVLLVRLCGHATSLAVLPVFARGRTEPPAPAQQQRRSRLLKRRRARWAVPAVAPKSPVADDANGGR